MEQNERPGKYKLNELSINFTLAICCYKCGDFIRANDLFNNVITLAPTFHYAEISKKYLDSIENNEEYPFEKITLNGETCNIPTPRSRKKFKIIYAVCFAIILFGVIGSIINYIMAPKQPEHFKGLDYYSTQSDVYRIYGKPDEIKEYTDFKGQYYDNYYDVEYLGITGDLWVNYYYDSDIVNTSWFTIDSTQFTSYEEYKAAANKTYNYFSKKLSKYRKVDESNENGKDITWYNDKGGYSYRMFEGELTFSGENDVRECTVFEFSKYYG